MDAEELRETVQKASGAFEVYRVIETFKGYRRNKNDEVKAITVEILDAGQESSSRYTVKAEDEDGRRAGGNPSDRIDVALATLHWYDLDQ
jgi:hypothetical protein